MSSANDGFDTTLSHAADAFNRYAEEEGDEIIAEMSKILSNKKSDMSAPSWVYFLLVTTPVDHPSTLGYLLAGRSPQPLQGAQVDNSPSPSPLLPPEYIHLPPRPRAEV